MLKQEAICVRTVVIANIWEYNRRALAVAAPDLWRAAWRQTGAELADIALFWCGDDKLVITPYPVDEEFLADVAEALSYRNVHALSPQRSTDSICEDIMADSRLFALLIDTLRNSRSTQIVTWGVTKQLYTLLDHLQDEGVAIDAPEVPPRQNYWTTLYLESKAGFREFCQRLQHQVSDLLLPEGFICSNKEQAVEAVAYFYQRRRGFVLKANYGTGGVSDLCYDQEDLERGLSRLRREIIRRMSFDHFWKGSPVIVEEYIGGSDNKPPGAPTVDFLIAQNGQVSWKGSGLMVMRGHHLYSGICCGRGSLEPPLEDRLIRLGRAVGQAMAHLGYRGWFDIDFVVDKDDQVLLTEINARRASPCHVFDIGERLLGSYWYRDGALYANDHLALQKSCSPDYTSIRKVFQEFNKAHRDKEAKAIPTITSHSLLRETPYIGYAVLAGNAGEARKLALTLEKRIKEEIGMKQEQ